jgi:hypothetical protein
VYKEQQRETEATMQLGPTLVFVSDRFQVDLGDYLVNVLGVQDDEIDPACGIDQGYPACLPRCHVGEGRELTALQSSPRSRGLPAVPPLRCGTGLKTQEGKRRSGENLRRWWAAKRVNADT